MSLVGKRPLRLHVRWALAVFYATLLFGCQVRSVVSTGCADDRDCADGRSCVDRICRFAEDAARVGRVEQVGRHLLRALEEGETPVFASLWPVREDYDWGFSLAYDDADSNDTRRATQITEIETALANDFATLLQTESSWKGVQFVRAEPGRYEPLPSGTEHARRNLERLTDTRILYTLPGDAHERALTIHTLVRLRERWRVLRLRPLTALTNSFSAK